MSTDPRSDPSGDPGGNKRGNVAQLLVNVGNAGSAAAGAALNIGATTPAVIAGAVAFMGYAGAALTAFFRSPK
jgi:hypothetical protein